LRNDEGLNVKISHGSATRTDLIEAGGVEVVFFGLALSVVAAVGL